MIALNHVFLLPLKICETKVGQSQEIDVIVIVDSVRLAIVTLVEKELRKVVMVAYVCNHSIE